MEDSTMTSGDTLIYMMVHINQLHYGYLYAHESLRKIEEKTRLEGHIKDYLMIAPHEKKFFYHETSLILRKSAEYKEDFSGYRATAAWTALETYAHNLLAQSWRKEFREIKTYSGFFKHQVESGLAGPELMLTLMGYRQTGHGTFLLEGPVDPDRVANVSRDSLVALVECQIICSIYAELIKNGCSCSWLDILEYRETHPCTPEQALHSLICRYKQRYMNQYRAAECFPNCQPLESGCGQYYSPYYRMGPLEAYLGGESALSVCHRPPNRCLSCQYQPSLPLILPPTTLPVPTGQLIELESSYLPDNNVRKSSSDKVDSRDYSNSSQRPVNLIKYKTNKDGWDGWGYSQNPDNKKTIKHDAPEKRSHYDLEDAIKNIHLTESQSSYASTSTNDIRKTDKPVDTKLFSKKKTKPDFCNSMGSSVQTLGREPTKKLDLNYMTLRVKLNDKWECSACTFHNSTEKEVCEMCSKSRSCGKEAEPLVSGGRQCPQCTLVNQKGVTLCDACGANLKHSPTYI